MSLPDPRAPVDVIRREAELAVAASSLRRVAREIGVSAMGLRAFLRGEHAPQAGTVRKLHTWYAARVSARGEGGEREARVAITLLLNQFPRADHPRVRGNLLRDIEREFILSRMRPPAWLATLRDEREEPGGEDAPGRG